MPGIAELTFDITLEPQDVYQPFVYSWPNLVRWVSAPFACYLIYTTRPIWLTGSQLGAASALLEPPLFCAFVFIAMFSWPYLRVRSMFQKYPALRRSRRVSFSGEGMRVESEDAKGDYKWSLFYQIVETPKTFLLMQSARGAIYIPKRCLARSDEIVLLRRLIRDNFTGKRRLRTD
jgi:YcxB-like protein